MSSDFSVFVRRNVAYFRYFGTVTPGECIDTMSRHAADPRATPEQCHLVDLSGAEDINGSFMQIADLVSREAGLDLPIADGTPCALYAPTDLSFGIARMYQQLAERMLPFDIVVCRTAPEALAHVRQIEQDMPSFLAAAD